LCPPARVLIVDRSQESRELLRSLLIRQGAEVVEARESGAAADLASDGPLDLIVVDNDAPPACGESNARLAAAAARKDVPIVVVGTARRRVSPLPTDEFVAKPYHYGALIRRIEELLGNRP
jgi:DNA-binding response OmpR family regulator